jgi:hypothetical protein
LWLMAPGLFWPYEAMMMMRKDYWIWWEYEYNMLVRLRWWITRLSFPRTWEGARFHSSES